MKRITYWPWYLLIVFDNKIFELRFIYFEYQTIRLDTPGIKLVLGFLSSFYKALKQSTDEATSFLDV